MDKKSIVGFVLIMLIFVGYMWWVKPSDEEIAARRHQDSIAFAERMKADSIAHAEAERKAIEDSLYKAAMSNPSLMGSMGYGTKTDLFGNLGVFNINKSNAPLKLSVHNKVIDMEFHSVGASVQSVILKDYQTFDNRPLQLITPNTDNMDLAFVDVHNDIVNSKRIPFAVYCNDQPLNTNADLTVGEGDSLRISFRAYVDAPDSTTANNDSYLEFLYTIRHDNHEVDFDVNFHNLTQYVNTSPSLTLNWLNRMNRQEQSDRSQKGRSSRNKDQERFYSNVFYKNVEDNASELRAARDDEKQITTPIEWVAFKQQFFCAILMADDAFRNAQQLKVSTDNGVKEKSYLCDMSSTLGLDYDPADNDYHIGMGFYYGPTKYRMLRDLDRGVDRILPLGWGFFLTQWVNRFAIIPVFNLLESFGWNYGIIIIVLTLLLKLVLSPLTFPSYKTSAVTRHLKPEVEALNKKFPKQEQAMQKQQAMSALYKKAGINPMAGCLPVLIQFPILIAMYRFYPASIELRQKGFLWCNDLSSYDSILDLGFNIPFYGDHVSLFCLLMFGMQFFYTWFTMKQQTQESMPGMKFMMYFMPFMMLFIFNSQSAALNIYYFFNLVLSMAQMYGIRLFITEEKVRNRMARVEASTKNKPQKKSKFQQRLEEMQRMNEELQRQRNKK